MSEVKWEGSVSVLTFYGLSAPSMEFLRKRFSQKPNVALVSNLPRTNLFQLLSALRSIKSENLVLPVYKKTTPAAQSILQLLGFLTSARRIFSWKEEEEQLAELSRLGFLTLFIRLCRDNLRSRFALIGACAYTYFAEHFPKDRLTGKFNSGKVLYLKLNFAMGLKAGGSVGHVAGVINGLVEMGIKVDYVAIEEPPMARGNHHVVSPKSIFAFPDELNQFSFDYQVPAELPQKLKIDDFDFIYQRLSTNNLTGLKLSRKFKIPLVLEYNGSEVWASHHWGRRPKFAWLSKRIETLNLRQADYIMTISKVLVEELIGMGISPERIIYYPNCVDTQHFSKSAVSGDRLNKLRESLKLESDEFIFGFLGTFGKWHGIDVLCKAIEVLARDHRAVLRERNVKFLFMGDGLYSTMVQDLIAKSDTSPFVLWTGLIPQAEARDYLALCRTLLSPHVPNPDGGRFFGSPTKLFEYLSMGIPVIASDLEQIGEIIGGNRSGPLDLNSSGYLITPGKIDELVQAILLFLRNSHLIDGLGRNGRIKVIEQLTWEHHVNKLLEGVFSDDRHFRLRSRQSRVHSKHAELPGIT